jgi:glycyl-tRNA synthetase beta chain
LRARFNDARFFWEFDQRVPLVERVKLLENVTFQKDLGSYATKADRVYELAGFLAGNAESWGAKIDTEALGTAVKLAKTDLTTELVKEFTELQGVIGGLYAVSQGISKTASYAIYDQYSPAGMSDRIPRSFEGAILGIADRADTIANMFKLGMEPTGSKDPFSLRRSGNGIIKILAESGLPLTLAPIVNHSVKDDEATRQKMREFLHERLEFYLREARGFAYDVVAAVLAPMRNLPNYGNIADAVARATALTAVRGSEDFLAVSAAFKRMKNILTQAAETGELKVVFQGGGGTADLAEVALWDAAEHVEAEVKALTAKHEYVAALERIATLRPLVDEFFEQVMVLDPNPIVRRTRLAILSAIVGTIRSIADLSEIVAAG